MRQIHVLDRLIPTHVSVHVSVWTRLCQITLGLTHWQHISNTSTMQEGPTATESTNCHVVRT
jgi:hypothetical protein